MLSPLRVLFAGTPDFAERHLAALIRSPHKVIGVLTQPDRPAGRGKKRRASPVKCCALDAGIEVIQPSSLSDDKIQAVIRALIPDVIVVVAYGLILPSAVLNIPKYACINVHASLLPRWRGAAPIQRAVEAGDVESGVTIMQMEAGLDTGPMLATAKVKLTPEETGGSLHDKLAELGSPALLSVLKNIESSFAAAKTQNNALANYAHKIDKSECGITWSEPAGLIGRKVRAFSPVPACFSYLAGERVKILEAKPWPLLSNQVPGSILRADRQGLLIGCGVDALLVSRAQFPGGKPLPISELLNAKSAGLSPGVCFDSSFRVQKNPMEIVQQNNRQ